MSLLDNNTDSKIDPKIEGKKVFLINVAYWTVIIAAAYLMLKYAIGLIMPFVLALLFSSIMRPSVRVLTGRFNMNSKLAAILCDIVFFGTIGTLAVVFGLRFIGWASERILMLPSLYTNSIEPGLRQLTANFELFLESLELPMSLALDDISPQLLQSIGDAVSRLSMSAVSYISSFASRLPQFIVNSVMTTIATFFMSIDYDRMTAFILRILPDKAQGTVLEIRRYFVNTMRQYGKSYLLILLMTFSEIFIGLLLLRAENAFVIAAITAALDIIPVFGTGAVVIPWAILSFIQGNNFMAVGLIILYLIITIVRQIMEPRIIGIQVGIHPLATLMGMFVGVSLLGILGMFAFPIIIAITTELLRARSHRAEADRMNNNINAEGDSN